MTAERVIINADDLGISEEVNDAIFDLMAKGRISSATVMANGPALQHAASKIKHFPRCSFGAHLNLTQFHPLLPPDAAKLLVGPDGLMSRGIVTRPYGVNLLSAMYHELLAQVERLGAVGIEISHFDSHHHVHTSPQILPVIKALQRRFRIRKIRISKNIYTPEQAIRRSLACKKAAYNFVLRKCYATRTTAGFTELLSYHAIGNGKPSLSSVELMVHPGAAYAAQETAVLESAWLETSGVKSRLISYAEL
jgi:predicted glycoside hydrolase/deacetylase ChbG (UPF0249 family)